jgi:putative membrane protein
MDFLSQFYPWIKAFHIISVISWMAGLLYLPRLFVYHCAAEAGSVQSETFKIMEKRLLNVIMTPAMLASWLFGLLLLISGAVDFSADYWVYVKLVLVVGLSSFHTYLGKIVQKFSADENVKPARFFRLLNEVPTVIMIFIVVLVLVKPF